MTDMKNLILLLFTFLSVQLTTQTLSTLNSLIFGSHSNEYQPIRSLIESNGYPLDIHLNIRTEDGYLLNLFRIPRGIEDDGDDNSTETRPVVFLMHGILGGAEDWVVCGPEHGLAYLLADAGFDVWMGNARGTTHSRKHVRLDPDVDSDFWKFSWHEIGVYDLPAMLTYIQGKTGEKQIFYIGHSQGTTAFFVMCSMRPEFNKYIRLMVALAPVAYMTHAPSLLFRVISTFHQTIGLFTQMVGLDEVHPSNQLMALAGQSICNEKTLTSELCANLLFLVGGYDSVQLNRSIIPLITNYAPTGAATRQFLHFAQGIRSGKFQLYDYGGFVTNLNKYGSITPPSYDISKITCPVALFYSSNDQLVATQDVERLYKELPNAVYKKLVPFSLFNHLDFLYASDVIDLLYADVYSLMKKYASVDE